MPRKQWLRPTVTEKLFTGTLNNNQTKHKKPAIQHWKQTWQLSKPPGYLPVIPVGEPQQDHLDVLARTKVWPILKLVP